ncbi:MAG: NUDIX hydrolase [Deltaproteobacteria bacterium]|nr:NUDIX hydrolase [Deltaproteobacteria bacterium]
MMKRVDKELIWCGKVYDFNSHHVLLPNGKKTEIGVIHHPGSSAIIPVFEDGAVTLVYQHRTAVDKDIYELPSGSLLPGEDPLACAKRELQEECGLVGSQFEKIGELLIAPWYSDERIYLFIATGLVPCEQHLDEDEFLTPHRFTFDHALSMVEKGEIQDATTIIGLKMAYSIWKKKVSKTPQPNHGSP